MDVVENKNDSRTLVPSFTTNFVNFSAKLFDCALVFGHALLLSTPSNLRLFNLKIPYELGDYSIR